MKGWGLAGFGSLFVGGWVEEGGGEEGGVARSLESLVDFQFLG